MKNSDRGDGNKRGVRGKGRGRSGRGGGGRGGDTRRTQTKQREGVTREGGITVHPDPVTRKRKTVPVTETTKNKNKTTRPYRGKRRLGGYRTNLAGIPSQPPSAPTPARFPGADLDNPLETPAIGNGPDNPIFKGSATPDKLHAEGLAADLDFYGTNEGLTLFDEKNDTQMIEDENQDEAEGSHSLSLSDGVANPEDEKHITMKSLVDSRSRILQRMRRKLKEQEEYIGDLEDTVLELQEKLEKHRNSRT